MSTSLSRPEPQSFVAEALPAQIIDFPPSPLTAARITLIEILYPRSLSGDCSPPLLNLGVSRCFIEWLLSLCPQRDIVDCLILDTSRAYSGNFRYLHE